VCVCVWDNSSWIARGFQFLRFPVPWGTSCSSPDNLLILGRSVRLKLFTRGHTSCTVNGSKICLAPGLFREVDSWGCYFRGHGNVVTANTNPALCVHRAEVRVTLVATWILSRSDPARTLFSQTRHPEVWVTRELAGEEELPPG